MLGLRNPICVTVGFSNCISSELPTALFVANSDHFCFTESPKVVLQEDQRKTQENTKETESKSEEDEDNLSQTREEYCVE